MHAALLLPAMGLASATYLLARRMCARPFVAAAAAALAPVTLVSATTVMSDVLMLCLYVFAICLWVRGIDEKRPALLVMACLFAGASALTKYFGASAIVLMPRSRSISSAPKVRSPGN